jgi:alginate O-acetyltransferase complex protein AlgI
MHGIFLTLNHLWREIFSTSTLRRPPFRLGSFLGGTITFTVVVAAWVVFRSNDMAQALTLLKAMFGVAARPISFDAAMHGNLLLLTDMHGSELLRLLVPGLLWVWLLPNSTCIRFIQGSAVYMLLQAAIVLGVLYLSIDKFGSYSPFLYFQF